MINWLRNWLGWKKPELVPLIYGEHKDLKVGDKVHIVLDNQKLDYIAGMVGKSIEDSRPGTKRIWKVTKLTSGEPMLEYKGARIFLNFLEWVGPNQARVAGNLVHGEEFYSFYREKDSSEG